MIAARACRGKWLDLSGEPHETGPPAAAAGETPKKGRTRHRRGCHSRVFTAATPHQVENHRFISRYYRTVADGKSTPQPRSKYAGCAGVVVGITAAQRTMQSGTNSQPGRSTRRPVGHHLAVSVVNTRSEFVSTSTKKPRPAARACFQNLLHCGYAISTEPRKRREVQSQ